VVNHCTERGNPVAGFRRVTVPTFDREAELIKAGASFVIGFDEVGKGAWAGPLVVGAAVLPQSTALPSVVAGVRDSKTLTEKRREAMFEDLGAVCAAWSIGAASHFECDSLGMVEAQRLAARRACAGLQLELDRAVAIIDGNWDFVSPHVGRAVTEVKADSTCLSVAVASVLAKVSRDRMMREMAGDYPLWSFETNKGYPCAKHRRALQGYGPSAVHRTSWAFMDNFVPWMVSHVAR
jgi:ribonuclease HII